MALTDKVRQSFERAQGFPFEQAEETTRAACLQKKPDHWGVKERLQKLKLLKDGWYDGVQGSQLPEEGVDWLIRSWYHFYPLLHSVRPPYLFPTIEGNIQAEWAFGSSEILLTVDIKNYRGRWHSMDMKTQSDENDEEHDLDLSQLEAWDWIFQRISGLQQQDI